MMAEDNDEIVIDLREIFGILKKRIGMIAGITALFVVCAIGYCFIKAPVYEAVSIIKVPEKQIDIFKSRSVMEPVVEKYVAKGQDGKTPSWNDWVKGNVKFSQEKGSDLHKLTVQGSSPEQAAEMNQAIIDNGIKRYSEINFRKIDADIAYAEKDLQKAKVRLIESIKLLSAGGESRDILVSQVSNDMVAQQSVLNQLDELRKKRNSLELDVDVIDSPMADDKPVAPRKARICVISLVLGLIIGCVSAVVKEKI